MQSYCLFDTVIGPFGIAWSAQGLTRLRLPERDRDTTEKRLRARTASLQPDDPPPAVAQVITDIQRYLTGERIDFSPVAIDLSDIDLFRRSIYEAARAVGYKRRPTVSWPARSAIPTPRGTSARQWDAIPSRSSFRVTGSSRPATSLAAFPRTKGLSPKSGSSLSREMPRHYCH